MKPIFLSQNKDNDKTFSGYDPWDIPSTFMKSDMGVNKAYNLSFSGRCDQILPSDWLKL